MKKESLVIASRESPLAMAQTRYCQTLLEQKLPDVAISILPMKTKGDKFLETSLDKIGGKDLFTKELETALLDGRADLAVHSMKDMPTEHPNGLGLAAILKREDSRDVLISPKYPSINDMPYRSTIATSSIRRKTQLLALRPDLRIVPLRGNINTRLNKASQFDGIILACAGLNRLNFQAHITQVFSTKDMLPAAGQGALGIECRNDDRELKSILSSLSCQNTQIAVQAEREVVKQLGGNCHTPVAVYATCDKNQLTIDGLVASADGRIIIRHKKSDKKENHIHIASQLAKALIDDGALTLLSTALT